MEKKKKMKGHLSQLDCWTTLRLPVKLNQKCFVEFSECHFIVNALLTNQNKTGMFPSHFKDQCCCEWRAFFLKYKAVQ